MPVPSLPGDQVVAFVLLDVAIILVVARLVGALALRVGQPRVVGEILAGVLLGPSLLGASVFRWDEPWAFLACDRSLAEGVAPSITSCFFPAQAQSGLNLLGQLALILFMFLVGLELDTDRLRGRYAGIATVAVGVVAIPVAAAFLLTPVLFDEKFLGAGDPTRLGFTLMVGAMLAVTAFPVAARILQEKGLAATPLGVTGIAAAAAVTVLMFLAVGVARGVAAGEPGTTHLWRLVGTLVYLAVMWFAVRPLMARLLSGTSADRPLEGTQLAAVLVLVLASAYAADRIGVHVIVGGFVAGLVLPRHPVLTGALVSKLSDVAVVFLLPVFLAYSGLRTDFTTLTWAVVPGIALFVVVAVAAKWGGGLVSGRLGGLSWAESNALGILMNCRGLLVLVVALVALNAGVISPQMQAGVVVMALVTTAMTGPLVDRFLGRPAPAAPVENKVLEAD
ncbi:cation:proton antiporter [Geodermatophilus sp. SYSU D00758]